ncbi:MAG: M18 family aminopeptidase [Clostridia bacterium]|nr:M18 family aminopeptidase [Clostridia bacterium]
MTINEKLFDFIKSSPTPFHAVATVSKTLDNAGYTRLSEADVWGLRAGGKYYVTRNGSSLIAFRVPEGDFDGFMLTASHSDSPCFKIKENPTMPGAGTVRLSTERYGGMLCSTWMDRPLSVAGRVVVSTDTGVEVKLVDLGSPCAVIPNVAIHMNRKANDGMSYDASVDMIPLYAADGNDDFKARVAEAAGVSADDIVSTELMVYCADGGVEWNDFISAPRLDDLQCAFASLEAFTASGTGDSCPVYCLFDNEEVGSLSKQGADSTFLYDTLCRVNSALGGDEPEYCRKISNSFLVSCDNAHSIHPNHPEFADKNHTVYMNRGIVIKYNANQKYTSNAVSTGIFKVICREADAPVQFYANRADMAGGSTLGNISNSHVSLTSVDIGLPQLAMHSAYETAGKNDTETLIRALTVFFGKSVKITGDGSYTIK